MKARILVFRVVPILVLAYFVIIIPLRARDEKRRRAELHLLNLIQGQVTSHLDTGGQWPTNWASLSNAVNWELEMRICQYNQLPLPTDLYVVLPQPIDFNDYHRSIFLVRSKARTWAGQSRGRWVIGRYYDGRERVYRKPRGSTNRLQRAWYPEELLPIQVRSYLSAQAKR